MKRKSCIRCSGKKYEVPEFTIEEKILLTELKRQNKFFEVSEKIKSLYNIENLDAKFSMMHINKLFGKCNRCKVDYLEDEYVTCPKCKSLNFNWKLS